MIKYLLLFIASARMALAISGSFDVLGSETLEDYNSNWSVTGPLGWDEAQGGWAYALICKSRVVKPGATWANTFISVGGYGVGVNRVGLSPIPTEATAILQPDTDYVVSPLMSSSGGGLIATAAGAPVPFHTPPRPKKNTRLVRKNDRWCEDGSCSKGMAVANAHAMMCSLNLTDTPLGYSPPYGPSIEFNLTYNQRESSQPASFTFSNLGPKWTHNWLGYVEEGIFEVVPAIPGHPGYPGDPAHTPPIPAIPPYPGVPAKDALTAVVVLPGGGSDDYGRSALFDDGAALALPYTFTNQNDNRIFLVKVTGGYEQRNPDGSKQVFGLHVGSRYFLTQMIDTIGNIVTLGYDGSSRLTTITDATGQVTTLAYELTADPLKITKVTDPFGRFCQMAYNAAGQLSQITDVIGLTSQFTYQAGGDFINSLLTPYGTSTFAYGETATDQWLTLTDPMGGKQRVEYHDQITTLPALGALPTGLLTTAADDQLRYTLYWDKKAMLDKPGDPASARLFHWLRGAQYQTSGTLMDEKKVFENRVVYNYEGQTAANFEGGSRRTIVSGRVLDDGASQLFQTQYDTLGNVVRSIDPLGRQTDFIYDSNGLDLLETRQKTGTSGQYDVLAKFTYNNQHLPLTSIDMAGQVTTFTYNGTGQIRTVTNAKGETTTFWYHATGQPGASEALSPTATGYLVKVEGAVTGSTTRLAYDSVGRVRTLTDSEGYATVTDYDNFDRATTVTFPDGTTTVNGYDRLDLASTRDRRGLVTKMAYNPVRQLVSVTDPLLRITQYNWCTCGAMVGLIDPAGQQTRWVYDTQARLVQKIFADGSKTSYAYETTTSRLASLTDARAQVTNYQYYLDGAPKQMSYTNAAVATPTVTFTYDPSYFRVATMVDGTGTTTYAYNPVPTSPTLGAGRLNSVDGPLTNDTITYTYDELGRVLGRSINGAANASSVMYDALGRVSSSTNPLGTFSYGYVSQTGRIDHMDYPNGQRTNFGYYPNVAATAGNGDQRLQQIQNLKTTGGANLSTFGYTYDLEGIIQTWSKQFDTAGALPSTFGYDVADQLTEAAVGTAPSVTKNYVYRYTKSGNRSSEQIDTSVMSASHNPVNQLMTLTAGGSTRVEGTVNEPSTVRVNGLPARVDGNNKFSADVPLAPGTSTISVAATDGSGNISTKNYQVTVTGDAARSFAYDVVGNLTDDGAGKTYDWDAANRLVKITQTGAVTEFVYDGVGRRVKEKLNGSVIKQWIWCGGAQPCEERDASNAVTKRFYARGEQIGGVAYYYTRDHLGSVRELTDASGAVRARYDYDPYGRVTKVGGDLEADFGFTGFYRHQRSLLSLTLYRAYDPEFGRWLSRDPIGEADGTNIYRYVDGSTVNAVDQAGAATLKINVSFTTVTTAEDRLNAIKQIDLLRSNLAKCSQFGMSISLDVNFTAPYKGTGRDFLRQDRAVPGHHVLFAWTPPPAGGETAGLRYSVVSPTEIYPETLSHEIGHQGNYRNTANPGGKTGKDPSHSGDFDSLMYYRQGNKGQVDECWCKAMLRMAQ